MNKKLFLYAGIILLGFSNCTNPRILDITPIKINSPPIQIVIYASTDNRNSTFVSEDFAELMDFESHPHIQLSVLFDSQNTEGLGQGVHRGVAGYWDKTELHSIFSEKYQQSQGKNVNLGEVELLTSFLEHSLPMKNRETMNSKKEESREQEVTSVLILWGESGTVFEGPVYDQGSADFLSPGEISSVLVQYDIDLLVVDTGYSAGLEFVYELYRRLSDSDISDMPLLLLSPGPFPKPGRDYRVAFGSFIQNLDIPESQINSHLSSKNIALQLAAHLQSNFLRTNSDKPQAKQVIIDVEMIGDFVSQFSKLLDEVYPLIDTDSTRIALRNAILRSSPKYFEVPGLAYFGLGAILGSIENVFEDSIPADLLRTCKNSLHALYPSQLQREIQDAGQGELTLLYVSLYGNGRVNPVYPDGYTVESSPLAFAKDLGWCPSIRNGSGFLYRLWLEAVPDN